MTLTQARWRLLLLYEEKKGWRESEANLAEERALAALKDATS